MESLVIVTPSWFIEVDLPVVRALSSYYNIDWMILFQKDLREYAPADVIRLTANLPVALHMFHRKYRRLHPHNALLAFRVARKLASISDAHVYFNTLEDMYLLILVRLCFSPSRIIIGVHDFIPHRKFSTPLIKFTHQLAYRFFSNFHFFSETQRQAFLKKYPQKKTWMIPMYMKDYGPPGTEKSLKRVRCHFLFFGQMRYNKGIDVLTEAINLLCEKTGDFLVILAGAGTEAEKYRHQIRDQSCVIWDIRIIPDQNIPDLFANADFLVLPYRDVTQSGPLWIAFRYGVPVIVSDLPGFKEWITEGETGFFVPPEDPQALADTMLKALNMSLEEKDRMQQNVRHFVRIKLDPEKITAAYRNMFSGVHL